MRARVFSALLLLFSLSLHAQSVSVWPAQTFTGDSTGTVMQLNSIQSVGSAASGVLTLVGTSLTTVTFAVQASTDGGLNYFAIPVYLVASPTTAAATSITATASAQYGINLAGVTHLKIVTSGTFTATSVSFQLATSPNGSVAKSSSGGSPSFTQITVGGAGNQVTLGPSNTPPSPWTFDLTTPATALNSLSSPSGCLSASLASVPCLVYSGVFTGLGAASTTNHIIIYSTSSTFTGSIAGNILTVPSPPTAGFGIAIGQTLSGSGVTSATILGFGDTTTVGEAGTYILSGAPQTVASEAMSTAGAGAPANAMVQICPIMYISAVGSAGTFNMFLTATTPGGRSFSSSSAVSVSATGANSQISCFVEALLSGSALSFWIQGNGVTGTPVWETEPTVYRIR